MPQDSQSQCVWESEVFAVSHVTLNTWPRLVVLFGKAVGPLGGGAWLGVDQYGQTLCRVACPHILFTLLSGWECNVAMLPSPNLPYQLLCLLCRDGLSLWNWKSRESFCLLDAFVQVVYYSNSECFNAISFIWGLCFLCINVTILNELVNKLVINSLATRHNKSEKKKKKEKKGRQNSESSVSICSSFAVKCLHRAHVLNVWFPAGEKLFWDVGRNLQCGV